MLRSLRRNITLQALFMDMRRVLLCNLNSPSRDTLAGSVIEMDIYYLKRQQTTDLVVVFTQGKVQG